MKTVFLTALGSSSALSAVKTLKEAGYRTAGCDLYPREWNEASLMADVFLQGTTADDPRYGECMRTALNAAKADFLIPLTDPEVDYWCGRKIDGVTLCVPPESTVRLCRSKLRMADFLTERGLCECIPTRMAGDWSPAPEDFPILLKPEKGRSSQHQYIVHSISEYRETATLREDYIAQPYLPGVIHTVDTARDRFGHVTALCRSELLRTVNGLGTTVRVLPGHPLEKICAEIAAATGFIGVCNIEFIERDGHWYFLEVNPRFSGGIGFSKKAGVDFAALIMRIFEGESIEGIGQPRPCVMTRHIEPIITLNE